ncbi:MAG: dihydrofolate reductase family protein [Calditrichia bacterium]
MRKLIFAINVTLDGFADHTAMIADSELHDFFTDLLGSTDIILFGRTTYQLMEDFWPAADKDPGSTESMLRFAERINSMPKIVFSRTLKEVHWSNTRLIKENMVEEVRNLQQQPGRNLAIGSISLANTFMKLGLIDEYRLLVHPVILGKGKRLFEELDNRINLKLADTKKFDSGVVVLHYLCSECREHEK